MLCMKESNDDSDCGCSLRESIHWGVWEIFPPHEFQVEIYTFGETKTKQFSNSFFLWLHFRRSIYVFWLFLIENNKHSTKYIKILFFPKSPMPVSFCHLRWCKEELSQNEELRGEKNDEVEKLQAPTWTNLFSNFVQGNDISFFRRNGLRLSRWRFPDHDSANEL